jgi:hypothetical protein
MLQAFDALRHRLRPLVLSNLEGEGAWKRSVLHHPRPGSFAPDLTASRCIHRTAPPAPPVEPLYRRAQLIEPRRTPVPVVGRASPSHLHRFHHMRRNSPPGHLSYAVPSVGSSVAQTTRESIPPCTEGNAGRARALRLRAMMSLMSAIGLTPADVGRSRRPRVPDRGDVRLPRSSTPSHPMAQVPARTRAQAWFALAGTAAFR